jgi:hypothetical protein
LTTRYPFSFAAKRADQLLLAMPSRLQTVAVTVALTAMTAVLWGLTHRYPGIDNDAQIYAFQALARIHPALRADLYLQNTSQDNFTVFSPFYAMVISWCGLSNATQFLTVSFTAWYLVAAWKLARSLGMGGTAWLALGAIILLRGEYGGAGVFHITDTFLSARLPAQALVLTALFCHFDGRKWLGIALAIVALLIHPLMALPGLLLLLCLWVPYRIAIGGAIAGVLAVLSVATAARILPAVGAIIPLMDSVWRDIVVERSHFLFLEHWSLSDWLVNARPFICLMLSAMVFKDARMRKISICAILVGAAGLAVAGIAGGDAPIAFLIQGQAWRWAWITGFLAILLFAPTALQIWEDRKCGPLCAILLIAGWTFPAVDGTACLCGALLVWSIKRFIPDRSERLVRFAGYALGCVLLAWMFANCWNIATSATAESGRDPALVARLRSILGLKVAAATFIWALWTLIRKTRRLTVQAVAALVLCAAAAYVLPKSLKQEFVRGSAAQIAEFSDWRDKIPEASTVVVADKYEATIFVWLTLLRPDYSSLAQSAGVVFSRATALEIRRRSEVLLPLMNPEWKLLTLLRQSRSAPKDKKPPVYRPLTAENLTSVCGDPALGFVVAHENVGFDPIQHVHAGPWKDWYLYDCQRVRPDRGA